MKNNSTADLALIAVFAALIAVCAIVPGIPMPGSTVPITLQTLGVLLTGLILGPWRGFLAVLLYLVVGFAGLPVFAQGTGGLAVFSEMSIGYLLAFPFAALVCGALSAWFARRGLPARYVWSFIAAAVGSFLIIDPAGICGMAIIGQVDLLTALGYNMPFVIGDGIKCVAAGSIAVAVNKAFPILLATRKPVTS